MTDEQEQHAPENVAELETAGERPPRRRRWKTVAFVLASAVVLLVALEIILRLTGYGGSVALVVPFTCADGTEYFMLNPNSRRRFFFREPGNVKITGSATYREMFPREKPATVERIVVVGGTAALGYPYAKNVSFATYLQSILDHRYPAKSFEAINCGVTAVSSYVVLDNVRELVRYSPDLIVVYSGHNEFYGTYAPSSAVGAWRWRPAVMIFMRFQRTKLYLLVKGVVGNRPLLAPGEGKMLNRTHLIAAMPRNEQIRLNSRLHESVTRNYRRNLEAMVAAARRHDVPLVLCTLAVNERDCGPLRSLHRGDMSKADLDKWQQLFDAGQKALNGGDVSQAAAKLSECVRLDPECADGHFLLARALEGTGDHNSAARHYRAAVSHDGMRFRAGSTFSDIAREVVETARQDGARVALADVEAALRLKSPKGLLGLDMVLDHVHPSARGIYWGAFEMARAVEKANLLGLGQPPPHSRPVFKQCNGDTAYAELDELVVSDLMIQLFGDYPFDRMINRREVLDRLKASMQTLEDSLDPIARTAYEAWQKDRSLLVRNVAANAYYSAGKYPESAREVHALLRQDDGYDAMTIGFLFHLYMCYEKTKGLEEGRKQIAMAGIFERARDQFAKFQTLPRRDRALQYLFMGKFYVVRNRFANAVAPLEKALELTPDSSDALDYLLHAYANLHKPDMAVPVARRLKELVPDHPFANAVLGAAARHEAKQPKK